MEIDNIILTQLANYAKLHLDRANYPNYIDFLNNLLTLTAALPTIDTTTIEPLTFNISAPQKIE